MKRLIYLIGFVVLSASVFAVTYPSRPYRSNGRLYQTSDAIVGQHASSNSGQSFSVGSYNTEMLDNNSSGLASLPTFSGNSTDYSISAEPAQFASTTFDTKVSVPRYGPPSTEGDDPDNPDLWQPIGDAPIVIILMALIYALCRFIRQKRSQSSDCQLAD